MLPIDNVDVCKSIEEALEKAKSYQKEIFIIGGSSIYEQFLPITDKMYISYLKNDYAGDTYFPNFNKENWEIIERKDFTEFEFIIFQRK